MKNHTLMSFLPMISFVWLIATVILGGLSYEHYNHVSQFISELGATGTVHGKLVNYLGFLPTELLILLFVFMAFSAVEGSLKYKIGLGLIAIYAALLSVAAIFPCDYGCRPETPTLSHQIHFSAATLAYLSVIAAIFLISSIAERWGASKFLKIFWYVLGIGVIFALFNLDETSPIVGVFQRLLETTIYVWLISFGCSLRNVAVKN